MAFLFFRREATIMNAVRQEPHTRVKPTHTFWPAGRRPEPASAKPTAPATEKKEDEHADEEPGYGFGV
jgi:hypothetical protein